MTQIGTIEVGDGRLISVVATSEREHRLSMVQPQGSAFEERPEQTIICYMSTDFEHAMAEARRIASGIAADARIMARRAILNDEAGSFDPQTCRWSAS